MTDESFEQALREGTDMADRTTAQSLARCSPEAAHIWAALATCQSNWSGVPLSVLAERLGLDLPRVRAAAVVLHALKLVGFDANDPDRLSHAGVWGPAVEKVLGGDAGSALWPRWDYGYDHRGVLVGRGEV